MCHQNVNPISLWKQETHMEELENTEHNKGKEKFGNHCSHRSWNPSIPKVNMLVKQSGIQAIGTIPSIIYIHEIRKFSSSFLSNKNSFLPPALMELVLCSKILEVAWHFTSSWRISKCSNYLLLDLSFEQILSLFKVETKIVSSML